MRFVALVILLGAFTLTGCRSNQTTTTTASSPLPTAAAVKSRVDVCNLLTSADLKELQGEAYKDAQRSDRPDGEFIVAQCYYALPTAVNSVVVSVTTAKDDASAPNPKTFWEQMFGKHEADERGGKEEREREKKQRNREKEEKEKPQQPREREEGEEKKSSPPKRVKDLGDEAFWAGSPIGGALYVLKNDLFFRISVGGAGDQTAKLNKSKTLAQKSLKKI
jgi:hypothetical protein